MANLIPTYTLRILGPAGMYKGPIWIFEASDDDVGRVEVARFLKEFTVEPKEAPELRRDRDKVVVPWTKGESDPIGPRLEIKQDMAFWCPACGAKPEEPCELSTGILRTCAHLERCEWSR